MIEAKDIHTIFLSSCDHNEKTNNHGLFQMFEFFKENLKQKSIYLSTLQGIYTNNIDVFDVSHWGGRITLAEQINVDLSQRKNFNSWRTFTNSEEEYRKLAARLLIKNLPKHKFIAIADKTDIDLLILEKVMNHFNSKLLIISAVNNTWTGFCSYPEEFDCDKYRTEQGCQEPCPAITKKRKYDPSRVAINFNTTRKFVNKNINSVYLNVGNSYSLKEANQSTIFKNVEKILIPLKNVFPHDNFEILWNQKQENRKKLLNLIDNKETKFLMMWSAQNTTEKRKGMNYFISSLETLKQEMQDDFYKLHLVLCANKNKDCIEKLNNLGIPYTFTGFIGREEYESLLSACDIFCSTTISDAGPRTTYESAALATPVISFDNCNAADFINKDNGALVKTRDYNTFAKEILRFTRHNTQEKKKFSLNLYETYKEKMDTQALANKWQEFFGRFE